ncbi:MAG TPA: aldehyde dehydrogenase family protein [Nitrososphaerales archaeon]|nr:aldehyde dehydrogenase family protein [Nitrososphaerales archaeon]
MQSQVETAKNLIGGKWQQSTSGQVFYDVSPADTSKTLGAFQLSDNSDVRAAFESARTSFPKWSGTSPIERGKLLFKVAEILAGEIDKFSRLLTTEEGKTIQESKGEVQRSVDLIRFYAGQAARLKGDTYPSSTPRTLLYSAREAVGVISILTPWNFPIAIPTWKMAPALACGNTIVFKPASKTPLIAYEFVRLLQSAGIPDGVVNFVTGSGEKVGDEMVTNENIDAISFTGSYEVGARIQKLRGGASKMIRIQLEMGGKNPTVVDEHADLAKAVQLVTSSAFGLTGQACTATSRVIVHEKIAAEFKTKLTERVSKLKVGNGLEDGVDMGPAASEAELKKDLKYIEIGKSEGAKLLLGGDRPSGDYYERGYYINPTIFSDVASDMSIARQEIFGPVLSMLEVRSLDEAIEVANDTEFGLTSAIVTNNLEAALEFAQRSKVGIVKVNRTTPGVELQVPFGGVKHSSSDTFKEQGEEAIEFYTKKKAVYLSY